MVLSESTAKILKNFASINPNLVVNEGNTIKTVSEAKNVLATAVLDSTFPRSFGLYDLNEFLSVVSLVEDPQLAFEDTHVLISDGAGRSRVKYYYSDTEMLTQPKKDIIMPESEVSFVLTSATLGKVRRAASALGHNEMSVSRDGNVVRISVLDNANSTSNVFSVDVAGEFPEDAKFNFVFDINNLKMIDGDYDVSVSSKLISQFKQQGTDLTYWVALEKSSNYGA